jgi:spore germination cell wall hydrolase CwlJ-like protein
MDRRYRRLRRERRRTVILTTFLIIVAVLLILIIGNQNYIMVQNTDILDQQNNILLELDEQSIDDAAENRSQVKSEPLTGEARDIVERVVAAEARGEDLQGMMAVAQVIKDRSDLWDMHPVDVVFAEGQFARPYEGEISDEVKLAVANVFDGGMRVFEEPTTHFYSGAEPYWANEKIDRGSIGCHRFLY